MVKWWWNPVAIVSKGVFKYFSLNILKTKIFFKWIAWETFANDCLRTHININVFNIQTISTAHQVMKLKVFNDISFRIYSSFITKLLKNYNKLSSKTMYRFSVLLYASFILFNSNILRKTIPTYLELTVLFLDVL